MPTKWEDRPTYHPLGSLVREGRRRLRLTQEEFAERVGISQAYVSSMERGSVRMPDVEIRRRLAAVLGMSHVDLLINMGELDPHEVGHVLAGPVGGPYQKKIDALEPESRRAIERVIDDLYEAKGRY